jgi:hypothetical protein
MGGAPHSTAGCHLRDCNSHAYWYHGSGHRNPDADRYDRANCNSYANGNGYNISSHGNSHTDGYNLPADGHSNRNSDRHNRRVHCHSDANLNDSFHDGPVSKRKI